MARIRTVKPEFFRHELLQDLEMTHAGKCPMLVFEGLWGHCDREGRFAWRPKQLKLDILPFLPFDMAETLEILEKAELVVRYEVDGERYGWIPSFTEHQAIGGKEADSPSKYPNPPKGLTEKYRGKINLSRGKTNLSRGSDGEVMGKRRGMQEGKGREGKGETRGTRLSSDWKPSELLLAWASKERPDLNLESTVASFRDYWAAKPGAAGSKLDWDATFRNWVRGERQGARRIANESGERI